MIKNVLISIAAIVAGLIIITFITECIEMLVVSLSSDKPLSELASNPSEYFSVRNRPLNIVFKLFYNSLAAFTGGYVCVMIAQRQPLKHAIILATIQTAGFVYGMTASEYAYTTPLWLWFLLIFLTITGVIAGSFVRNRNVKLSMKVK